MWDSSEGLELMLQASLAEQQGDISKALELIDRAIRLAENARSTEHVLQWKTRRALLLTDTTGDFSDLITITQETLDFYTRQKDILRQLESLMNLVGLMVKVGDKSTALRYLDDAENLLSALTPSDVAEIAKSSKGSAAIHIDMFLGLRSAEINRIRQYLAG